MSEQKINILMVGGKRCGKSTILASMVETTDNAFKGNMTLEKDNVSAALGLQDKINEINDYFIYAKPHQLFTPDDNPSFEEMVYSFTLKITGKNSTGVSIEFTDVPGEFYQLGDPGNEKAKQHIEESDVLMIAIDTPAMMEDEDGYGYGKRHLEINKAAEITQFIKSRVDIEHIQNRLILLVPIKCERYYYDGRIKEVTETVKTAYRELIAYFMSPGLAENCTVAITPILSIGGIEFFRYDDRFQLTKQANPNQKYNPLYRFLEKQEDRKYNPKYSEQPLLYLMAFASRVIKNKNYKGGLGTKILAFLDNKTVTKEDLLGELSAVEKALVKDSEEGYEIFQNPFEI